MNTNTVELKDMEYDHTQFQFIQRIKVTSSIHIAITTINHLTRNRYSKS